MSRLLRLSTLVALVAALACVPACSSKSNKTRVCIVTNCTAEFWSICEAGAKKAAQEDGVELEFRQPEKDFDASVQMPIIESWVAQNVFW